MPDYTHNDVEYEIAIFQAQVGDLVDHDGQPVIVYYSRVRVKPPADKVEDHTGCRSSGDTIRNS